MTDEEKVMLVETTERSKSNTHQIDEIKDAMDKLEIKANERMAKLEDKTEDIHRIATSIELISKDVSYMKEGQVDLSNKVDKLSNKVDSQIAEIKTDVKAQVDCVKTQVDNIEKAPYEEFKQTRHEIKSNILGQVFGAGALLIIGALGVLVVLVANGTIKL